MSACANSRISRNISSACWPSQERSVPVVAELEAWMRAERATLSRHNDVAKAMNYMLKRWDAFTRFLGDGRICITNNAAERALRGIAFGVSLRRGPSGANRMRRG